MKRFSAKNGLDAAVLLILVSCAHGGSERSSGNSTETLGLRLNGNFQTSESTGDAVELKSSSGEFLRIKQFKEMPDPVAREYAARRMGMIRSLMESKSEPYFGTADPGPHCSAKSLPSAIRTASSSSWTEGIHLYATQNFTYGACSEKLDVWRSQALWVYCGPEKSLYEVRGFYAAKAAWKLEPIAVCK